MPFITKGTTSSTENPIAALIGIGFFALSIWALVCAARVTMAAISLLLGHLDGGIGATVITNIVLSAVAGFFAAAGTELLRQNARRATKFGASFVSSLFQKRLGESTLDTVFWSRVIIGGFVGLIIGAVNGSTGVLNFPQFLLDAPEAIIHEPSYPIVALVGGGFGGPGGTGFLSLAFLVLVILISALVIGLLAGVLLHLLLLGLAGMTKGAVKAYFTKILSDEPEKKDHKDDPHPIGTGAGRGLLTGVIVGLLESIFTVLGVIKFYSR